MYFALRYIHSYTIYMKCQWSQLFMTINNLSRGGNAFRA
jgi:hypothetical protein